MEGRNLAKNFFTNGQQSGQTRLSSSDVLKNISAKSSESVHFKGSTSNSIISMIGSTLQSDRVVVTATQTGKNTENHLKNTEKHQKQAENTKNPPKNDCYTGNHNYKPTLANYRQTGGSSGAGFLPRQITKPKTSKYSRPSKTSSSALAKYLNADKKRSVAAKDVYMVPQKERAASSKYQNSLLNGKYAKVAKNEKESKESVDVVPSKYEIYARKRENSKKYEKFEKFEKSGNVVLSKKPKIKTEKYEHVKLIKEIQELGEAEQAQLRGKIDEIREARLAIQEENERIAGKKAEKTAEKMAEKTVEKMEEKTAKKTAENTGEKTAENDKNGEVEESVTVDALLPVKSEKKGKKFMLKRFLKDVDTFSSGGSEGAPSELDAASVKSDGSGENDFQKTGDYVPGEGLKTSYNC